ncbi:MAG: hypothetical protein ACRDO7_01445 [Nocardioidaceae bacterium]
MSQTSSSVTAARPSSRARSRAQVVGWLAVAAWLLAPYLAWNGFWAAVTFFGETPTQHEQHLSSLYLGWAAVLGLGMPLLAFVLGWITGSRALKAVAVLQGVAVVAVPVLLVLLAAA